uniref:Uncharacterized protein n=1 Tax=Arundo donax TaxID=35708 RepID=A0A0A9GUV8_ARUDO
MNGVDSCYNIYIEKLLIVKSAMTSNYCFLCFIQG